MDLEAELIRSSNWGELKRLYSGQVGHAWELAWVNLLRFQDVPSAIKSFEKALRDPHFEQASYIMLWKLGARPQARKLLDPHSLRLYEAFCSAEPRPLAFWLGQDVQNKVYSESILSQILNSPKAVLPEEIELLEKNVRSSATSAYFLGQLWEKKLKDFAKAEEHYQKFFSDPWVKKILNESRRLLFDNELSERIRFGYGHRDGLLLRRLFKALEAKSEKLKAKVPPQYPQAFGQGIRWDDEHLTENLIGAAFWKRSEWSPTALFQMLRILFAPEEKIEPDFVRLWSHFFNSEKIVSPSLDLGSDALCLWQIHVELHPESLSEALLRFPTEERFLFLWSVRQHSSGENDPRRWPDQEQESETVRKNLERAFERSSNKLLWFDRLRRCGCSQTFYEYALGRVAVPISWVLEDLEKKFIKSSTLVRLYFKEKLSVVAPSDAQSHLLSSSELLKALSWLTPAEKQEVLLSRFVLSPLPVEILNEELLDLLWDAQNQVGAEVFRGWRDVVLQYLQKSPIQTYGPRKWAWVESAWEDDPRSLELFSPPVGVSVKNFPWDSYLSAALNHQKTNLIVASLQRLENDRTKIYWIEKLMAGSEEKSLKRLILSLQDASARARLLTEYFLQKSQFDEAVDQAFEWMETTAILNEQAAASKIILQSLEVLDLEKRKLHLTSLLQVVDRMKALGMADFSFLSKAVEILASIGQWESAWKIFVEAWWISEETQKIHAFDRLLEISLHSRKLEDTQRILIQRLFDKAGVDPLQTKILEVLLDSESVFQLQHIRREFVDRVSKISPLHPEILKRRAQYDFRATLLWQCFYGDELSDAVQVLTTNNTKRRFELWGLTEVMLRSSSLKAFTKYLEFYDKIEKKTENHEFYETAKRILSRLIKQFQIKKKISLSLRSDIKTPLRFCFDRPRLEVRTDFFQDLDEDLWATICVGFFQMITDREKGLFDEVALIERFFQGMLLSGSPIATQIRLLVWLAMHEQLLDPQVIQHRPQELIQNLPLLNHLLIFYLGDDFSRKVQECGIQLR